MPWVTGEAPQDDPDATDFIRELAKAEPKDLGAGRLGGLGWVISFVCATAAGVQVFDLTKTLPVEPYGQSGPQLLTRNTTRRAWKASFECMRNGTKRVAMLGIPGIGKSRSLALGLWHLVTGDDLQGLSQPEAIVYEARQGGKVFLFTKDRSGQWKAQSQSMHQWDAASCEHLKCAHNWYLVDAFLPSTPIYMVGAKTCLACSPDRSHYSNFLKDGGQCIYVEAWTREEVAAAYQELEKPAVEKNEVLKRFEQVGGTLRILLADKAIYNEAVQLQRAEAADWTTVKRAFEGDLNTSEEKKMPTRLFTYRSDDGISRNVTICSHGAAALLVEKHYDQLVGLWKDAGNPRSWYWLEDCVGPLLTTFWPGKEGLTAYEVTNAASGAAKKARWERKQVNDLKVEKNLTLLESDSEEIFHRRWQMAVKKGSLEGKVLRSPGRYPGIDYLLEFNHGIQVTNSETHTIAATFSNKLQEMFESVAGQYSFTLTFLITENPGQFAPKREEFDQLKAMAGPGKSINQVCVQVVQIPKSLNSLS